MKTIKEIQPPPLPKEGERGLAIILSLTQLYNQTFPVLFGVYLARLVSGIRFDAVLIGPRCFI